MELTGTSIGCTCLPSRAIPAAGKIKVISATSELLFAEGIILTKGNHVDVLPVEQHTEVLGVVAETVVGRDCYQTGRSLRSWALAAIRTAESVIPLVSLARVLPVHGAIIIRSRSLSGPMGSASTMDVMTFRPVIFSIFFNKLCRPAKSGILRSRRLGHDGNYDCTGLHKALNFRKYRSKSAERAGEAETYFSSNPNN